MVRSTRQAEPEMQGRHHHQQQQGPQDHRGGRARQDNFLWAIYTSHQKGGGRWYVDSIDISSAC